MDRSENPNTLSTAAQAITKAVDGVNVTRDKCLVCQLAKLRARRHALRICKICKILPPEVIPQHAQHAAVHQQALETAVTQCICRLDISLDWRPRLLLEWKRWLNGALLMSRHHPTAAL